VTARKAAHLALVVLAVAAIINAAVWRVGTSWLASCVLWAVVALLAGSAIRERS
jgi:hypothetical protein